MEKFERFTADIGYYLYDNIIEQNILITAYPVEYACSRFTECEITGKEIIDLNSPIPETPNGLLYRVDVTSGVDFATLQEAKDWANSQPWGPVIWRSDHDKT